MNNLRIQNKCLENKLYFTEKDFCFMNSMIIGPAIHIVSGFGDSLNATTLLLIQTITIPP